MNAGGNAVAPDRDDVQGNVASFNKDDQRLVFLRFADQSSRHAFLAELPDDVATCGEALDFNRLYSASTQDATEVAAGEWRPVG